jgi:hypothetical protein
LLRCRSDTGIAIAETLLQDRKRRFVAQMPKGIYGSTSYHRVTIGAGSIQKWTSTSSSRSVYARACGPAHERISVLERSHQDIHCSALVEMRKNPGQSESRFDRPELQRAM